MRVNTEFKEVKGIGRIPVDWEVYKLGNITEIVSGGTPKREIEEYWNDGDILWATPTDVTNINCKFIGSTNEKITELGLKNSSAKLLPVGTVIMCSRATIGPRVINTVPISTNQGFKSFICNNKYITNEYLYYLIDIMKNNFVAMASGSTFLEISKTQVDEFKIGIPKNVKEQEKIAQILSNVDMNIEKTEEAIAKYEQVKKGLMDDLLTGKVRIKDGKQFRETRFKDVKDVGKIPWDWEVKKVEEISDVIDSLHETPTYSDNGYKMIRVNDIKEGKLDTTNAYKVGREVYNYFTKKYKPQKGDIILSRVGSYGISCYIDSDESICLGQNTVVINPHIIELYLYYYLNSKEIRNQIDKVVVGSSQKTLSLGNINNLYIGLPSEEEQKQISKTLLNQNEIIEKEIKYLEKLKKIKVGIIEDLLTGKVRVNID